MAKDCVFHGQSGAELLYKYIYKPDKEKSSMCMQTYNCILTNMALSSLSDEKWVSYYQAYERNRKYSLAEMIFLLGGNLREKSDRVEGRLE